MDVRLLSVYSGQVVESVQSSAAEGSSAGRARRPFGRDSNLRVQRMSTNSRGSFDDHGSLLSRAAHDSQKTA